MVSKTMSFIFQILIIYCLTQSLYSQDLDEIDKSDIPQIIEARGFICEPHYIVTSDGYILGNYRIVNPLASKYLKTPLKPIVIQSGFLGSAVDFIINSPRGFLNESVLTNYTDLDSIDFDQDGRDLGFILANLGYDVWLTNPRGNYYSAKHVLLDPKKDIKEFWSFSLDEMALIDLPTIIDYVLDNTGTPSLGYIGFSRGSLLMFALLSEKPEYSDKISPYIAIAPPVFLNNINLPLKFLSATSFVQNFIRDHPGSCFDRAVTTINQVTGLCSNILIKPICDIIKLSMLAIDGTTSNATRLDVYLSHLPCGSSCWDFVHFAQRMNSDEFTRIDLGEEYNLQRYGTKEPPKYNLKNIKNQNIVIFQSIGDSTATPVDVQRLINELTVALSERYIIQDPKFSHLDFVFDNNVGNLVNKPIAKILDSYREM